ncbi:hypothetical protein Tco_0327254 [Tanacetum coccineum]
MLEGALVQAGLSLCWPLSMVLMLHRDVMDIFPLLIASNNEGVLGYCKPVIPPVSPDVVEGRVPPSSCLEVLCQKVDHDIEDVNDEVPLADCLTRKRSRQSDQGWSSKKKKNKSKNIVGDDSRASGSQAGACKINSHRVWLLILRVVGVAYWLPPLRVMCPSAKSYLESIMLYARLYLEDQVKRLKEQLGASSVPGRIELKAQTLKANDAKVVQRHNEEVAGLRGRIAELETEVKHKEKLMENCLCLSIVCSTIMSFHRLLFTSRKRVTSLGAHNLSVKIHEKFLEVPKVKLKLDGNVAVRWSRKQLC